MSVSVRDIKKKSTFETIRLKIVEYVIAAVDEARKITETDSEDEHEDDEVVSDDDESTNDESENTDKVTTATIPRHLVKEYKFGLTEFTLLTERLDFEIDGFIIKLELFDGYLLVRVVPGDPHGIAVGVFTEIVNLWARDPNNLTIQGNPLISAADASMCLWVFD